MFYSLIDVFPKETLNLGFVLKLPVALISAHVKYKQKASAHKDIARNGDETHPSVKIYLMQVPC